MIRALVLLLALSAFGHDLWVTGVTVDLRQADTVVTARVHKQNLGGNDIGGEIARRVQLFVDGKRFEPSEVTTASDPLNDLIIWTARASVTGSAVRMEAPVFPDIPADRTVVTLLRGGSQAGNAVLDAQARSVEVGERLPALVLRFVREGVLHILEGADHIAFLIAILLPIRRVADLVKVITAFTVAHSITLTMAATGNASLSPAIVEPAIALSIVAAALENLHSSGAGTRLRMLYAFGFGLIHGFGFAGSLAESGLPSFALWPAVLAFNAGVEVGQLLIVSVLAPIAAILHVRKPVLRMAVMRYASVAIMVLGLAWSVQRLAWW